MAKTSYLNLTNKILRRITQTAITDVSTATGHALIVTNLINEAQNELFTIRNWYSLYATRIFTTTTYTASTITFNNANPDTITDSASGMGSFTAGEILISGSSNNDGTYTVDTATAGTLTLQSSDSLTAEAAGNSITITAITYPVASDFGRTIDLTDTTNSRVLTEDVTRVFDEADPDINVTGIPSHFAFQGDSYRLWRIPGGTYKIRDRYWKQPTALSVNADTSDLPIETENSIIFWAWYHVLEYLNKFEQADRVRRDYERQLQLAIKANQKKIDKMYIFQSDRGFRGTPVVNFPDQFGIGSRRI